MLPSIENDLLYCLNILESIGKIKLYSENYQGAESFYNANDQHIEWQNIRSFRNRIVHDYTGINIFIPFKIITEDLPELRQVMSEIVASELNAAIFDMKEYDIAKKSQHYLYVDFARIDDDLLRC
jgi:hypothetical protein